MEQNFIITKEQFEEYQKLKQNQEINRELLIDIASGIKDILTGDIEEV